MATLDRRHFLGTAAVSLAGGAGVRLIGEPSAPEPATATGGWHQPRRDPGNTAVTSDPGPGEDGDLGWGTQIQPNDDDGMGFAVWNGTLLVPSRQDLVGVDAATGERRWTYSPEGYRSLHSSPRVRDGTAFLAVGGLYVYAVSLETRRPRWRYRTDGSVGAMVIAGNALCFSGFDDGEETTIALDTETGRTRWRRSGWWYDAGAADDRLVAVRSRPETETLELELVATDLETGETEWTRDLESISLSLGSSVVCLDDAVVVTGHRGTAFLESATGDTRTTLTDATAASSVAVDADAGRLYATAPDADRVAATSFDGETEWTVETPVGDGIAVGGETVYATVPDGLLALDAVDGDRRFAVSPPGEDGSGFSSGFEVTPVIDGDAVYHGIGDTVYEVVSA